MMLSIGSSRMPELGGGMPQARPQWCIRARDAAQSYQAGLKTRWRQSLAMERASCVAQVTAEDIYRVMPLCLRHRLRKDPLEQIDSGEKVQDTFKVRRPAACKA